MKRHMLKDLKNLFEIQLAFYESKFLNGILFFELDITVSK